MYHHIILHHGHIRRDLIQLLIIERVQLPFPLRLLPSVLEFMPTFRTRTSCTIVQAVRRRCRCVCWCWTFCHPRSQEGVRCIRDRCQPLWREVHGVKCHRQPGKYIKLHRLISIAHRLNLEFVFLAPMDASSYATWRKIRGIFPSPSIA